MVRNLFPDVRLIANTINVGFARANNQVLERCAGKYLLLLNPDTVVLDHAIDRVVAWMDVHPDVGVLGCRLVHSDGSFQRAAAGMFPGLRKLVWHHLFLDRILPSAWAPPALFITNDPQGDRDMDWVSGAAMLIRRASVEARPFDERFFMFGEDMELCDDVRRRGWRIVYTSSATILHHLGQSMTQQRSKTVLATPLEGPRTFFVRRHGQGQVFLYDLVVLVGYLLRWAAFRFASLLWPGHGYGQSSQASRQRAALGLRFLLGWNERMS